MAESFSLDRRHPRWETRLRAFLAEVRERPHDYGRHDCILFCAGIVEAVTGVDLATGHRYRYRTAAGARRRLLRMGFASAEALIDSLLPERPITFARRGDLVMLADGVPGGCIGAKAVFVLAEGLRSAEVRGCVKAWSVG